MYLLAAETAADTGVRGVAIHELLVASAAGTVFAALIIIYAELLRSGRLKRSENVYRAVALKMGVATWAGVPLLAYGFGLVCGAAAMMWDTTFHFEVGRELGLVGQTSHILALVGIFTMVGASYVGMMYNDGQVGRSAFKISKKRVLPVGPTLTFIAAAFGMMSFPLDDLWHRLFGLDVALWSPIHFILLGSYLCATTGLLLWIAEGQIVGSKGKPATAGSAFTRKQLIFQTVLLGGFAAAASVLVDEWNIGLPQSRMVFDPMFAAAVVGPLVAARLVWGRWGAIFAGLVAVAVFALLSLFVGGVLGYGTPIGALMIASAIVVEAVSLIIGVEKRYRFALVAALASFALAMPVEYLWSHLARPLPWSSNLIVDIIKFGIPMAVATSFIGVFGASVLQRNYSYVSSGRALLTTCSAVTLLIVTITLAAIPQKGPDASAAVAMTTSESSGQGYVAVKAKFTPSDFADKAQHVTLTSWQGGGIEAVGLVKNEKGEWISPEPVPYGGKRKTVIRVANGAERHALAISFPEETDINKPAVNVAPFVNRKFVGDRDLMQRERIDGTGSTLNFVGVAGCVFIWLMQLLIAGLVYLHFGSDGRIFSKPVRLAAGAFGRKQLA